MKKKNYLVLFGLVSLFLAEGMLHADSKKPILGKQEPTETTIIIKKEEPKKPTDELKTLGLGTLGGFVGGAIGGSLARGSKNPTPVTTTPRKISDRERILIENYAQLEDDYTNLERENIRLRRRITAYEPEVEALRANNRDLKQDLDKAREKKLKYKNIALQNQIDIDRLATELKKYQPEGPGLVPSSSQPILEVPNEN